MKYGIFASRRICRGRWSSCELGMYELVNVRVKNTFQFFVFCSSGEFGRCSIVTFYYSALGMRFDNGFDELRKLLNSEFRVA